MRSGTGEKGKHKKIKSGNSQFTRGKLEEEYNPKVRFFKGDIMSMIQIPDEEKYENRSKEQLQICNKAVNSIKEGLSIKIDWNTRSNFRTTKSLFPKLKTEPHHINSQIIQVRQKRMITSSSIEQKQRDLSKLLFKRHRKKYMVTKREQEEEMKLFGQSSVRLHSSHPHSLGLKNPEENLNFSEMKKIKTPKAEKNIFEVQDQLLNTTKLKILKDELKTKFYEIRESFVKKKKFKKYLFLSLHEEPDSH